MLRNALILIMSSSVVVGCADHPREAASLPQPCYVADGNSGAPLPTVAPENPPHANLFKLGYSYPENLRREHLQGRALVRLRVAEIGTIDSAELLSVEAPPQVEYAMCQLLRKLKYDVPKPDFESADSRTFVLGIRYCLGNCNLVPVYPGFDKKEIVIAGSL